MITIAFSHVVLHTRLHLLKWDTDDHKLAALIEAHDITKSSNSHLENLDAINLLISIFLYVFIYFYIFIYI